MPLRESVTGITEAIVSRAQMGYLLTTGYAAGELRMSALPGPLVMDLNRPVCQCGKQMRLFGVQAHARTAHAEIRIFDCKHCPHELRIMHLLDEEAGPQAA